MRRLATGLAAIGLMLTGCSKAEEEAAADAAAPVEMRNVAAANAGADAKEAGQPPAVAPGQPRIAYVYDYGFRIPGEAIPTLQRRHADLCEKQGPQVCRILEMSASGSEGDYAEGSLALAVAAPRARAFGAQLGKVAEDAGGAEVSSAISGEDLSKQIVDTEARLRARTLLRDRLMEVLATRKGTVAELVEAERGVAQVNEEIDQARSWLAEIQGRVDYSRVNISYASGARSGGGFLAPIREALGSMGSILGWTIAALIMAFTVLAPLALVVWGLRAGLRKLRRRKEFPDEA